MKKMWINFATGKMWIRWVAVALIVVIAFTWIMPSITQIIGVSAEEGDPLSRIYSMLTGTLEDPQTADDYFELANIAIGQRSYETAQEYLEKARSLVDPEDGAAIGEMWLKSASVHVLQGDVENAKICLTKVLENNPESTQAVLLQAQLMIEEGEYNSAVDTMQKYLEQVPGDANTRLTLAQLLESLNRFAEARDQYQSIYELQPDNDSCLLNALRCGFLNADYEETAAAFDAYLSEKLDAAAEYRSVAAFLKAACLMQLARHTEAVEAFRAAIAEGYDEATCYEQMVMCSFDAGDYEGTIQIGEEMIAKQLNPASADVFNQRMGASMMQLARYEEAVDYLSKSIEANSALAGSSYYRGVSYLALEKLAEAVADFTTSIDQNFLPQYCYYNRGVCYVQMLDYDSALNDFEKTLTVGDDENLIQGAKDILWQLVAYYENQAALTAAPEVQTADSITIDEASGEPEAETVPVQ